MYTFCNTCAHAYCGMSLCRSYRMYIETLIAISTYTLLYCVILHNTPIFNGCMSYMYIQVCADRSCVVLVLVVLLEASSMLVATQLSQ